MMQRTNCARLRGLVHWVGIGRFTRACITGAQETDFLIRNLLCARRLSTFKDGECGQFRMRAFLPADGGRVGHVYSALSHGVELGRKLRCMLKLVGGRLCVVAEAQGAGVVGFQLFYFNPRDIKEQTIHEGFIGILPEFQGRRLGKVLREKAIRHFSSAGLRGISSRVSLSNPASFNMNLSLGFEVIETYLDKDRNEERAYMRLLWRGVYPADRVVQ